MSEGRNEHERLSQAFAARTQARTPNDCPDGAQLFEAASGNLARDQRLQLLDHVAQCSECTEAWRIAMELGARPAEATSVAPAHTRTMTLRRTALAASVILAAGVGTYLAISPGIEETPRYRDAADPLAPFLVATGDLPRDRFVLRWSPGPPGSIYSVRLSTADLTLLLEQADITGTELTIPAAALAPAKSGDRLLWQVELTLPDGRHIASETQIVTLK